MQRLSLFLLCFASRDRQHPAGTSSTRTQQYTASLFALCSILYTLYCCPAVVLKEMWILLDGELFSGLPVERAAGLEHQNCLRPQKSPTTLIASHLPSSEGYEAHEGRAERGWTSSAAEQRQEKSRSVGRGRSRGRRGTRVLCAGGFWFGRLCVSAPHHADRHYLCYCCTEYPSLSPCCCRGRRDGDYSAGHASGDSSARSWLRLSIPLSTNGTFPTSDLTASTATATVPRLC